MRPILVLTLLGGLAWSQPIVINRVTAIDAIGKAAQPDMTVVIAGDRIAAVSPWKNVHVVDGTGKFLIPGLWDMHVHGDTNAHAWRAAPSRPLWSTASSCSVQRSMRRS